MKQAQINRINELAKKKKSAGLSPQEAAEQKALYKEYLADIRKNVTAQMNTMVIEKPDGTKVNVKDLKDGNKE